jgi:hypothetical protein
LQLFLEIGGHWRTDVAANDAGWFQAAAFGSMDNDDDDDWVQHSAIAAGLSNDHPTLSYSTATVVPEWMDSANVAGGGMVSP